MIIKNERIRVMAVLAAVTLAFIGGGIALYYIDPGSGLVPPCALHSWTGYYCAGCGMTRAGHLAVHGHLWAAFRMNPLAFVLGVLIFVWTVLWGASRLRGRPAPQIPAWVAWAALAAILGFAVLRNLPFPPFCWLAPTPLQ